MKRLALLLAGVAVGALIGVWYGWVASPAQYTDTSPSQLRAEFQADYVLMVAEVYAKDHDLDQAAVQLSRLGRADLPGLVQEVARAYALAGYPQEDQTQLNDLARDLARLNPVPTTAP